jgi:hypothetical protein
MSEQHNAIPTMNHTARNDRKMDEDGAEDHDHPRPDAHSVPFVMSRGQLWGGLIGIFLVGFFVGLLFSEMLEAFQ